MKASYVRLGSDVGRLIVYGGDGGCATRSELRYGERERNTAWADIGGKFAR
jgi:hypothetical protein